MSIHKNYVRTPSELFAELKKAKDKTKHLKENLSFGVATILQLNFSNRIHLDLPEGEPPFTPDTSTPDRSLLRFDKAVKNLAYCVKGHNIPAVKKEKIFVQILESVTEDDAKIIIAAKDKKLTELYPDITADLVKKVAPELLK